MTIEPKTKISQFYWYLTDLTDILLHVLSHVSLMFLVRKANDQRCHSSGSRRLIQKSSHSVYLKTFAHESFEAYSLRQCVNIWCVNVKYIIYLSPPASSGQRVPWPRPTHQLDLQNYLRRAGGPQGGDQAAVHSPATVNSPQSQVLTVRLRKLCLVILHFKHWSTQCSIWWLQCEQDLSQTSDGEISPNKASVFKVIVLRSELASNFGCLKQVLQTHHWVTGHSMSNSFLQLKQGGLQLCLSSPVA